MKLQQIRKTDEGIVGIFTVVLIIALIIGAIAITNAVYVPNWLKESEFTHMELISNQFAQLKYALDIQSTINGSSVINSPITLGSREIPFIKIHQTYDELSIAPKSCTLSIESKPSLKSTYTSDSIIYTSHNSNYVDQSYVYEAGSLILNQYDSCVLLGRPLFVVTEYDKNITLIFINITGKGANTFVGGRGTYPIYTQITQNNKPFKIIHNATTITVQTKYPTAWSQVFTSSLLYSGIQYNINQTKDHVILQLIDNQGDYYNIIIKEINISAEIVFGVIE
jgi:hypothetical protein